MAGEYGSAVNLPPGFRFCPTDEELILHFLLPKARHMRCYPDIIPDLGYSMPDPWQLLHGKALWGENQYYFFRRVKEEEEMKMSSSSSSSGNGMWKEVVDDDMGEECIFSGNRVIGLKKLLVFCDLLQQAPHHDQTSTTNWFMQQYYLHHSSTSFNTPAAAAAAAAGIFRGGGGSHHDHDHDHDHQYNLGYCKWTLCRVEERKGRLHQSLSYNDEEDNGSQLSCLDEMYLEFDDDSDVTFPN